MENYVILNGELHHAGIKGMKWGVRRYRNKDGSLTPAGKKRYGAGLSDDARRASEIKKKKVSQMSNAELRTLNERSRLEQEYSRLNPGAVKKGWKFVAGTAGVMGTALAVYNNSDQLIKAGKKIGEVVVTKAGDMVMKDLMKNGIM